MNSRAANGENERAVYSALRDEVLKHTDIQNQLIALTITISGAAFTLGLQNTILPQISQTVILVFPVLLLFLAFGWVHSVRRIYVISRFIREKTQTVPSTFGIGSWEDYLWGDSEGKAQPNPNVLKHIDQGSDSPGNSEGKTQPNPNSSITEPTRIRKFWKRVYSFNAFYIFGVFALPQALAILVVYLQTEFVLSGLRLILLSIAVLSLLTTLFILGEWRVKYACFI
jgi:hypothetical protein